MSFVSEDFALKEIVEKGIRNRRGNKRVGYAEDEVLEEEQGKNHQVLVINLASLVVE